MLEKPDSSVTSATRCIHNFKTCRYYINNDEREGLLALTVENNKKGPKVSFYPIVNKIEEYPKSECEYFTVYKNDSGYIAKCKIMDRLLVTSQIKLCVINWTSCPIRKTAI